MEWSGLNWGEGSDWSRCSWVEVEFALQAKPESGKARESTLSWQFGLVEWGVRVSGSQRWGMIGGKKGQKHKCTQRTQVMRVDLMRIALNESV